MQAAIDLLQKPVAEIVTAAGGLHSCGAVISADASLAAVGFRGGQIRIWSTDGSKKPIVLPGPGRWACSLAFSPDGAQLVTASNKRSALVWSANGTGEPVALRGHQGRITSVAFSPDGSRVLTTSLDKTARVWRSDGTGEPLILRGHESSVLSAAFSPDGARVVTASTDKTARVWLVDKELLLRRLWEVTRYCLPSDERTRILGETPETAEVCGTLSDRPRGPDTTTPRGLRREVSRFLAKLLVAA